MNRISWMFLLLLLFSVLAPGQNRRADGLRRGKWRPQDVPDGYVVVKKGKYQIQTNCSREVGISVARHMNLMFKVYAKHFSYTKTPKGNLVIKLFQNRKQFVAYGRSPGAVAYYSPYDKEMVGYNTGVVGGQATTSGTTGRRRRGGDNMDTLGVFSHEGWHQYFHWICGSKIPFPAWCDEGIGEYFYPTWWDGDKPVIGAPLDVRLSTIQRAISRNKHIPLPDFVTYDQRKYYANPGVCYAQGWSLVHFFYEHPVWRKKQYVRRFVKTFLDQHSIEKTVRRVFPKSTKWDLIEEDWKNWVMAIKPVPPVDLKNPMFEILLKDFNELKDKSDEYRLKLKPVVRKAMDGIIARRREKPDELPPARKKPEGAKGPGSSF